MYKQCASRLRNGCKQIRDILSAASAGLIRAGSNRGSDDGEGEPLTGNSGVGQQEPCVVLNEIVQNKGYKNWMKVVVALRMINEFSIPIVEKVMVEVHRSLLDKYQEALVTDGVDDSSLIEEVRKMHRQHVYPQQIKRCCEVSKWLTDDGAWELAKVFFNHTQRNFRYDGPKALDPSKVMNLMVNCKLMEEHIVDYETCRMVLKVRNKAMHSSRFEFSDAEREESFKVINAFLDTIIVPSVVVTETEINNIRNTLHEVNKSELDIHAVRSFTENQSTPSPSGKLPQTSPSTFYLNLLEDSTVQLNMLNGTELAKLYVVPQDSAVPVRRSCSEISFKELAREKPMMSSHQLPSMKVVLADWLDHQVSKSTSQSSCSSVDEVPSASAGPCVKRKKRRSKKRKRQSEEETLGKITLSDSVSQSSCSSTDGLSSVKPPKKKRKRKRENPPEEIKKKARTSQ